MALFGDAGEAAVLARLAAAGVAPRRAEARRRRARCRSAPPAPLPAFPPAARVVDTTAAGDSFNGAYLAALLRGETEAACLAAGHAMAAEVIGHPGRDHPALAADIAGKSQAPTATIALASLSSPSAGRPGDVHPAVADHVDAVVLAQRRHLLRGRAPRRREHAAVRGDEVEAVGVGLAPQRVGEALAQARACRCASPRARPSSRPGAPGRRGPSRPPSRRGPAGRNSSAG